MSARVEKLARAVSTKTELEKELYIHDFICENIHYDKLKKPYSHEIIGPLGHGVGVCEGIAKSVKVLCDALGVWCIIVISEANPKKKIKYRHAWNIVKIGKTYYHLDATFDLSLSKTLTRHDYFNLSDDAIFRDHEPIMTDHVPCTDGSHFYYLEKKLSFTKQEEVKKTTSAAIVMAFGAYLINAAVCLLAAKPYFAWQAGGNETIAEYGSVYIRICMLFSFGQMIRVGF